MIRVGNFRDQTAHLRVLAVADLDVVIAVTLAHHAMEPARDRKDVALRNAERVRERGNPRRLIPVIVLPNAARIVDLHEVGIRNRYPMTHVYPGEHTRLDRPSLHAGLDFVLCREAAAEP